MYDDTQLEPVVTADPVDVEKEVIEILHRRLGTHGDYEAKSKYTQHAKSLMRSTPNWNLLADHQKQSLETITEKIGRILYGDPAFPDHWLDIIGYINLAINPKVEP